MKFFVLAEKALNELFINKVTYIIPNYQRLYSWESKGKSDVDSQVNVMWEDLINHFEQDRDDHYFMGSTVLIQKGDAFEVVDGQQRLTTLTLLFVAIKCMLENLEDEQIKKEDREDIKNYINEGAKRKLNNFLFNEIWKGAYVNEKKVRIERSEGFDYDNALKVAMECGSVDKIDFTEASPEQKKAAGRFFDNREYLIEQLEAYFLDGGIFTQQKVIELNNFIDFLETKVVIIQILCPDLKVAYKIFEVLNNRGLQLSNKDLFRNFIIQELDKFGVRNPTKKWLQLDEYEFSTEFLGRYVESKNARKQRYSAFNEVKDIYDNLKENIGENKAEVFYADIEKNLTYYSDLELLNFDNLEIAHRINFLKNSGNSRYINNILLALLRETDNNEAQLIEFLSQFECFVLYQLLGPSKRFQTKTIFETIALLNKGDFKNAVQKITLNASERDDLKSILKNNNIYDNKWAKLIMARYVWAKEMNDPADVINIELNYAKATLEHIIPQKPSDGTNWKTDFSDTFREDYTYKLGNMTLLTRSMNSRAKNYDFAQKRLTYQKTKLPMTYELSQKTGIDETYIKKRHERITDYLIEDLKL